jgi:WD40 repeat protein
MPQRLRVFISSPGDVMDERLRANLIVDKISQDFSRYFTIETYRWEYEPMLASGHFQDAIVPPRDHDIVILILWSRLGTPLPEKTAAREYRGGDGRAPVTGTEWEFEDALTANRSTGAPDILAFRNVSPASIDTRDLAAQARSLEQLSALNNFWRMHFADRGLFLGAYDEYRTLEEFAEHLERSLRKLILRRVAELDATQGASPPTWSGIPFRGLEPYEFEHAPIFFGRDNLIAKSAEQLAVNARAGTAFLLVSGASGSGKSSLVKAALVPHLMGPQRMQGIAIVRRLVFKPSEVAAKATQAGDLLLGLLQALTRKQPSSDIGLPELLGPGQDCQSLADHLRLAPDDPGIFFTDALARVTQVERQSGRLLAYEEAKLILVIDQLEELFTVPGIGPGERSIFIRVLAGLARSGAVWVVATVRADFWHRLAEISQLTQLCQGDGRIDVSTPSPAELAEMIRKPAEAAGLSFEVHPRSGLGLDALLAEDAAAAPGVLPLLSFTLEALYENDVTKMHGRMLMQATYESLGGLEGAIAKRANETVAALAEAAQKALPRALRALATVSSDTNQAPVARVTPLTNFPPGSDVRAVIDALTAARLLVATSDGATPMVRVAHEALISRWKLANDQLAADRRDLETRVLIERQQARWDSAIEGDKHKLLLHDPDLANARDLDRRWGDELSGKLREFIASSDAAAKAAIRRRWMIAALVMICLATLAAASFGAFYAAQLQRNNALIAQSQFLARDAKQAVNAGDSTLGALLAVAALPKKLQNPDRPFVKDAEYALEDAYANRRELKILQGHSQTVWSVNFSRDGTRLVTASDDRTARIWDVATGKTIAVLRDHTAAVTYAAFSPDAMRVVTTSEDGTARLWNAKTGSVIGILKGHRDIISFAAFSPDGRQLITVSDDKTARLWDGVNGKAIAVLSGHAGPVNSAVFSPDGTLVATASTDHTVRLWNAATGAMLRVISGHTDFVNSVVFSPDGHHLLTASNDRTARQWDVQTGAPFGKILQGHDNNVLTAVYSADGRRIVTASEDKTARVWDAETGDLIGVLRGHEAPVRSAYFSPDGWNVVTASNDGTARIWNAQTGALISVLAAHKGLVTAAIYSPDGKQVATASTDGTARLWTAEVEAAGQVLRGDTKWIDSVAYSPDGKRLATGSDDTDIRIWDTKTGRQFTLLRGHTGPVRSVEFSKDGNMLLSGSDDHTARVWSIASGKTRLTLHAGGRIWSAAFSPDGRRIVTGSEDEIAQVWDARTGAQILTLSGHEGLVSAVAYSPDGKRIVTGSWDKTARLWNAQTGALLAVLKGHHGRVASVAFSPDGSRIATASDDKTARLWDGRTGAPLAVLRGQGNWLYTAAFSPGGRRVITSSEDTTAWIWDADDGTPILVLRGHGAPIRSAAFSPDGKHAATGSSDDTIRLWNLPPRCQALIDWGRGVGDLPRSMTDEERAIYFLNNGQTNGSMLDLLIKWFARILPHAGDRCR